MGERAEAALGIELLLDETHAPAVAFRMSRGGQDAVAVKERSCRVTPWIEFGSMLPTSSLHQLRAGSSASPRWKHLYAERLTGSDELRRQGLRRSPIQGTCSAAFEQGHSVKPALGS